MLHSVSKYSENPVKYINKVYAEYHDAQIAIYFSIRVYIPVIMFFLKQDKTHAEQRCDSKCEIHPEVKEIKVSQLPKLFAVSMCLSVFKNHENYKLEYHYQCCKDN